MHFFDLYCHELPCVFGLQGPARAGYLTKRGKMHWCLRFLMLMDVSELFELSNFSALVPVALLPLHRVTFQVDASWGQDVAAVTASLVVDF